MTATKNKTREDFAIKLVHLYVGWRYWAFDTHTGGAM